MSYEGYTEYLCKNGHYWAVDVYCECGVPECSECGGPYVWRHSVDETNGVVKGDPGTRPARLKIIRHESKRITVTIPIYKIPKRAAR